MLLPFPAFGTSEAPAVAWSDTSRDVYLDGEPEPGAVVLTTEAAGDAGAAVSAFERALELAPEADWLHFRLAVAYGKTGDRDKAREHLAKRGTVRPQVPDPVLAAVEAMRRGALWAMSRVRNASRNPS